MYTLEKGRQDVSVETSPKRRLESPPEFRSPKEEVLSSREKTLSKKIGRGVTDSSFVELKDDGKGVFKTELYQNERAAYLIDRFLGINLTPPTTIRNLDGEVGSMQEFIPDAKMLNEIVTWADYNSFREKHREEFMKMWIFDLIIGNTDRYESNFLFSGDVLYAIDHGRSLSNNEKEVFFQRINDYTIQNDFFGEELPTGLVQSFKKFLESPEYQQILEDLLEEIYDKEFAIACLKRIRFIGGMIVKTGKLERPDDSNNYYFF